jgi:hypothetical protein
MNLTLVVPVLFLAGCHFCADELNALMLGIPFLGVLTAKFHNLKHKKSCPHDIKVNDSVVNGDIVGGNKQ